METSNTGDNRKPGTFRKGDPRINRNGRPRSFDAWRKLTQEILTEVALDANGQPIIINGHKATVAEMIARGWARDKKKQTELIEAAFGKVPQPLELGGKDGQPIEIGIKLVDYRIGITETPTRPKSDSGTPGQDENPGDGPEMG